MNEYTLTVLNRRYTQWEIAGATGVSPDFHPLSAHLFHKDHIRIDECGMPTLVSSYIRTNPLIPGVLVLEKNRTFGRTENKKRLLYKCIPDNKHLPVFLIPYDIQLGFSKAIGNKYVLFRFDEWTESSSYPRGTLVHVLGNVDKIETYTEYRLYCRNIHHSIAGLSSKTAEKIKEKNDVFRKIRESRQFRILPVSSTPILTIDPPGSRDLDDALSVRIHPTTNLPVVSVYIANVFVWLETLGLWDYLKDGRISTVYLPDKKIPMLPNILSDSLCSLTEGQPRFAVCVNIHLDHEHRIVSADFGNVEIVVHRNHHYESVELLRDPVYTQLYDLTTRLDPTVKDSHDLVAFWMTQANTLCGRELATHHSGIFRTAVAGPASEIPATLSAETQRFLRQWKNIQCRYDTQWNGTHELMNIQSYVHITSPIRRMVDVVNQTIFLEKMGLVDSVSPGASGFCQYWVANIETINAHMKSAQKVQHECALLHQFVRSPELIHQTFSGVVVEHHKTSPENIHTFVVYVDALRVFSRVKTTHWLDIHAEYSIHLFLFEDEDNIRQKIRFHINI
jgi:exoribonuclease R